MNEPASDAHICPRCRAVSDGSKIWCPACGRALPVATRDWMPPPMAEPWYVGREGPAFRLNSIGGLMVVIAVVAVVLGAFAANLGLGILATVLVTPAMVRLAIHLQRLRVRGRRLSPLEVVVYLAASAGLVALTLLAAIFTTMIVCASMLAGAAALRVRAPSALLFAFMGIGVLVFIAVAIVFGRALLRFGAIGQAPGGRGPDWRPDAGGSKGDGLPSEADGQPFRPEGSEESP